MEMDRGSDGDGSDRLDCVFFGSAVFCSVSFIFAKSCSLSQSFFFSCVMFLFWDGLKILCCDPSIAESAYFFFVHFF